MGTLSSWSLRRPVICFTVCLTLAYSACFAASEHGTIVLTTDLVLGAESDSYFFGGLTSVVEDSGGHIFVADRHQSCVFKFGGNGDLLAQLGRKGEGPGDLMRYFVVGVDVKDQLYVVGSGNRVEVVDGNWEYLSSHSRINPSSFASSIAILPGGEFAVASLNLGNNTTVDLYDHKFRHVVSFSETYTSDKNIDPRIARTYSGGTISDGRCGALFFLQRAPYLIRKYDVEGNLLLATTEGGAELVPAPPKPEINGDAIKFGSFSNTTGIAVLDDLRVVTTSTLHLSDDESQTLVCVYDENLVFLGSSVESDRFVVSGASTDGRALFIWRTENGTQVKRAKVELK